MSDIDDKQLRARFDELRDYDTQDQPTFLAARNRAEPRVWVPNRRAPTLRWAAAAALLIASTGIVLERKLEGGNSRPLQTRALINWQSPTASLLRTPARDLLAPPPILSSVFDGVAPMTLQPTLN
ncbi:MAG: hypothetical protein ACRENK_14145 [Gemmatimonadaceae bacterium]